MRFVADGPDLPHDLLVARDEGQVIFFCGAGVSRARAGLADFFGLANAVVERLGVVAESPARQLLAQAKAMAPIAGVGGLLAADRVFALLEREFDVADIREAVARALAPPEGADLSAHRVMLDLAKGPDGAVRLVTTNFDLLFGACDPDLKLHAPPYLPDPRRPRDITGITHLHGRVNADYSAADDDAFVLSSADFGRAYLAEGWATRFIRGLLDQYQLVFVGYTADDPPVQYLLEALNDHRAAPRGLYAFQPGAPDEAKALWRAKGVQAIPFNPADNFSALWSTLEGWADRARDPAAWQARVLAKAMDGPGAMAAFERGQVAHIVSTPQGAAHFAKAGPPAEWLAVLDPTIRYARDDEDWQFKPFERYGLDDDPPPLPTEANRYRNEIPADAWDGLAISRHDRSELGDHEVGALRGRHSGRSPRLVRRLSALGEWIAAVANQPIAAWWAAGQGGLHPDIVSSVLDRLGRAEGAPTSTEAAWRLLVRSWGGNDVNLLELGREAKRGGWTSAMARDYGEALTPRIKASRPRGGPPGPTDADQPRSIVRMKLDYPAPRPDVTPSNEILPQVLTALRRALTLALIYSAEIGERSYTGLPPIRSEPRQDEDNFSRSDGLARPFFHYVDLFQRLRVLDLDQARTELSAWQDEGEVASRLRLWAAGEDDLQSPAEAAATLLTIGQKPFWDSYHQRDLMLSIKARWNAFSHEDQAALEQRILAGREPWKNEDAESAKTGRAWWSIQRLQWLVDEGCVLTIDWSAEKARLMTIAPDWRDEGAGGAAASMESSSGWVQTDADASDIKGLAPREVLQAARNIAGQRDFAAFIVRRPLEGLAKDKPVKFLRALVLAGRDGQFPAHDWETFLEREARKDDGSRLSAQIARRLAQLPSASLGSILLTVSRWFAQVAKGGGPFGPGLSALWPAMLQAMAEHPETGRSAILGQDRDWLLYAVNAPSGALVEAMMDRTDRERDPGPGFTPDWLATLDQLFTVPGDAARYAAVALLRSGLGFFFYHDSAWTRRRLLSLQQSQNDDDRAAFWTGVLSSGQLRNPELFTELAPAMLALVGSKDLKDDYASNLAAVLLSGWGSRRAEGGRYITDEQMRHALLSGGDRFRSQVLWPLGRWRTSGSLDWRNQAIELLETTWPRQMGVRTSRTTERLLDLAISAEDDFPRMVAAVTPHLGQLTGDGSTLLGLTHGDTDLPALHPVEVLTLLYAVLGEAARDWPYGAELALARLADQAETALDPRQLELRRRLSAR